MIISINKPVGSFVFKTGFFGGDSFSNKKFVEQILAGLVFANKTKSLFSWSWSLSQKREILNSPQISILSRSPVPCVFGSLEKHVFKKNKSERKMFWKRQMEEGEGEGKIRKTEGREEGKGSQHDII